MHSRVTRGFPAAQAPARRVSYGGVRGCRAKLVTIPGSRGNSSWDCSRQGSCWQAPVRYKLVDPGTIFYNPMRILLGSIAMVDEGDDAGITSPDYVVFKPKRGALHSRWFYHWLRGYEGAAFIRTLARGAVRERMLFRRLAEAEVEVPGWRSQVV